MATPYSGSKIFGFSVRIKKVVTLNNSQASVISKIFYQFYLSDVYVNVIKFMT